MHFHLGLLDLLVGSLLVDDHLVAINEVSLHLMGEYSLQWSDLVGFSHLGNHLGHVIVLASGFQAAECCLDCLVGCQDHIGLASLCWFTNHDCVGYDRNEAINMGTQLTYDYILKHTSWLRRLVGV